MITRTKTFRGIELFLDDEGLWRDLTGTIYAFSDAADSLDLISRCGISVLSLPEQHVFSAACRTHDNAYSNRTIQKYFTRKEIDQKFERDLLRSGASKFIAKSMYIIVRVFGKFFWEGRK